MRRTVASLLVATSLLTSSSPFPLGFGSVLPVAAQGVETQVVYSNNFEGLVGPEWSNAAINTTPIGGRRFLGQFSNQTVSLVLINLPAHTEIIVSFDLFIIRTWDGNSTIYGGLTVGPDIWDLSVDGVPVSVAHTTFTTWDSLGFRQAYPDAYPGGDHPARTDNVESNTLGYIHDGNVMDSVYRLNFTFPHSTDSLELNFSASGLQSLSDESWGLDNVEVSIPSQLCYTLTTPSSIGGTIVRLTPPNCPGGYSYGTPVYLTANPNAGSEFTGWGGDASGNSTTTKVEMTKDNTVTATFNKPVVVLVHGWHGLPGSSTDTCGATTVATHVMDPNNPPPNDFGIFAKSLGNSGWDVWIARIATGPDGTPSIEYNAKCLQQQLANIRATTHVSHVTLIAHSMGGLVSRAYVESNDYANDVDKLITLGTPHTGTTYAYLYCSKRMIQTGGDTSDAACKFTPLGMLSFNNYYKTNWKITYTLVGGGKTPGIAGLYLLRTDGFNDGVVGANSGIAKLFIGTYVVNGNVSRYIVSESHSSVRLFNVPDPFWYPSYFNSSSDNNNETPTAAYNCVKQILNISGGICPAQATSAQSVKSQSDSAFSTTPTNSGHLSTGQIVTYTVPVDTSGQSQFNLTWANGLMSYTLTNPNGTLIDPAYAAAHPSEVSYSENTTPATELFASYTFTTTVSGTYTLTVTAGDVGAGGSDYSTQTIVDSPRVLHISTDKDLYASGDTAVITANLQNAGVGIGGATVEATIYKTGSFTDTVTLTDLGSGVYSGNYTVPNSAGYLGLKVVAQGSDSGTLYARQEDNLLAVSPTTVQLNGTYTGATVDSDNNGKYDSLNVNVGLTATQAGNYLVSGDLTSGSTVVAHSVVSVMISTGSTNIALPFNGDDIRRSNIDGAYTLTNLTVTDQQNGSVPAVWQAQNVWTTLSYTAQNFAATCYTLMLAAQPGQGGTVAPGTAPNCGGLRYTADSIVNLTASASTNFTFNNWSGDGSGNTNPLAVTMDANKTVIGNFTAPCYTLTLNVSPAGSGTASASPAPDCNGGTQYYQGTIVQVTATASPGYAFANWSSDASGSTNPTSVTMTTNKSITANFSLRKKPGIDHDGDGKRDVSLFYPLCHNE